MAIKGLAIPVFGAYAYTNSAVTYSSGRIIGHAVSYTFDPTTSDDNPLYGDNMIVEHDWGEVNGGTLTVNVTELPLADKGWLFGLSTASTTGGAIIYTMDDDSQPITVGFGTIESLQVDDTDGFLATIFYKCVPQQPSLGANTKGESIEWQTHELTFTVERDESAKHRVLSQQEFTTQSEAETWVKAELGVSAG